MNPVQPGAGRRDAAELFLLLVAGCALLLGLYARFKGLGRASLEADEYFTVQSVQNILRFGVPEYACGGYYPRALGFQYVVALAQILGLSGDMAVRFVAALSSALALPGIYLLGKRLGGREVGTAALVVLALSLWEVEISRFGRMYAPFQAVTVWYLVYFLKFSVDGERRAIVPMYVLTVLGILTWEGGVFLALLNLVAPFFRTPSGRLSRAEWLHLGIGSAVLLAAYLLATLRLRTVGAEPAFPADYDPDSVRMPGDALDDTVPLWSTITGYPLGMLLGAIPLFSVALALKWVWSLRARWPAALAMLAALGLAAAHQFAAALAVVLASLLLGLVKWEEIVSRQARSYVGALAILLIFWLVFGALTSEWRADGGVEWLGEHPSLWLLHELFGLPDVGLQIAVPWVHAVPVLTGFLAVLLCVAAVRSISPAGVSRPVERALLAILVCMAAGVGLSDPPRHETRYVFFLYPLVMVLAVNTLAHLVRDAGGRRQTVSAALAALLALVPFGLTEDFAPRHLLRIDSPAALMRTDLPRPVEGHIVPRSDTRGAADWLAQRKRQAPQALMINAFPSADYYFKDFDFTYIDRGHQRFRAFACRRGTFERWGNLPLVSTIAQLQRSIAGAAEAFMVVAERDAPLLIGKLAGQNPRIDWTAPDGQVLVLAFGPSS